MVQTGSRLGRNSWDHFGTSGEEGVDEVDRNQSPAQPIRDLDRTAHGGDGINGPMKGSVPPASTVAPRLLTARDVAALLGVPTSWVYEQSRLGRIPTVMLGRYKRFRREAIEAWVEQLEAPAYRTTRAAP